MSTQQATVFITGASSGIGKHMAIEYAKRGYNLALTARRLERLEQLKQSLKHHPVEIQCWTLDVQDETAIALAPLVSFREGMIPKQSFGQGTHNDSAQANTLTSMVQVPHSIKTTTSHAEEQPAEQESWHAGLASHCINRSREMLALLQAREAITTKAVETANPTTTF